MYAKTSVVLFLTVLFCGLAYAKPSAETCDPLKEATPGLYGLCVSFCFNHPPGDAGVLELSQAQLGLLEAYNRKRTYSDPDMPCFKGCPCFTTSEPEFIATHPDFYACSDFTDEVVGEREQLIRVWGDLNTNGYATTQGHVAAYLPKLEWPPYVLCNWTYYEESSSTDVDRMWISDFTDEDDQLKLQDCQAVIDYVASEYELPCETLPECEVRIVIDDTTVEDMSIEVNGHLVNDPLETCANREQISRVEWYWGDGAIDTFEATSGGYVQPFPNWHTYTQNLAYMWSIYAFDEHGDIISYTSRLIILW